MQSIPSVESHEEDIKLLYSRLSETENRLKELKKLFIEYMLKDIAYSTKILNMHRKVAHIMTLQEDLRDWDRTKFKDTQELIDVTQSLIEQTREI